MTVDDLSPEARTTIESRFPQAVVKEVEGKFGNRYEVELQHDGAEVEVTLHRDGTILEIETSINEGMLPEAVAATAKQKAGEHKITEVEKVERLAHKTARGLQTLPEPDLYYEIEWHVLGFEKEIKVNPDGTMR